MTKRHGADNLQNDQVIRICASCPSEEYNGVEAICTELHITTAFGIKGDFMEDIEGDGWFGK